MAKRASTTVGTTIDDALGRRLALAPSPGRRPVIDAGEGDLARLADASWDVLIAQNDPPAIFRRGREVVRIIPDDDEGVHIQPVSTYAMRHHLARVALWVEEGEPKPPPGHLVHDMLAHPDPPLPVLERITGAPVFAADGTLGAAPGYHFSSRSYYHPPGGFVLPEMNLRPSADEIAWARGLIVEELLGDFPFVGPADRAHAVALGVLPFARDLVPGSTPMHMVAKPDPGTGATLLVDVLADIATGVPASSMTEGRNEDEWRKRLTARLRNAPEILAIDNVRARLSSAALASAITTRSWEDRLMGLSRTVRLPVRCVWVATANNPVLSEEIARRTVWIRMDAGVERPWVRDDFRHPRLHRWTEDNRGELTMAFLTLVAAWLAEGRPPGRGTRLGMFEGWAETIGGILEVAGIEGFLRNVEETYADSDRGRTSWDAFVTAWYKRHGGAEVSVATLEPLARELLDLGDGSERSRSTKLGILLAQHRDRVSGRNRVVRAEHDRRGAALWRLAPMGRTS